MATSIGARRRQGTSTRLVLLTAVVSGIALLLTALVLPGAIAADRAVGVVQSTMFDVPPLPTEIEASAENSIILAADGSKLAELHDVENRVIVPLSDVPAVTQDAVIATEDASFYRHRGVNHRAVVRALLRNLEEGEISEGGSTITQQYVKNKLLTHARTFDRKVHEAVWAIELERRLTKQEILERYLNTAYFGRGMYGIGTAARFYFSKHVSQLTLAESAMLAGLIRAPERNNPVTDPVAARQRRDIVLGQMSRQGFITQAEAERARSSPIELRIHPEEGPVEPYFIDWVKRILYDEEVTLQPDAQEAIGENRDERQRAVFEGGLTVHTTLDPRMQEDAEETLFSYLDDPVNSPMGALVTVDTPTGAVVAMAVGPKEYGNCPEPDELATDGGGTKGDESTGDEDDAEADEDGADEDGPCTFTKVNPVVHGAGGSGRQAGSAFKPFVIAAALADGYSPGWSTETTSGKSIQGCEKTPGVPYEVRNYAGGGGGYLNMYDAVRRSSNVYHAELTAEVGVEAVVRMARELGIEHSPNMDHFGAKSCSIGLGAADVFPVEMANAYATFARRGQYCPPFAITSIEDRHGNVIYERRDECTQVLERGVADRVTDILRGPPGPGGTAGVVGARLGRPVAGKTGTTQNTHDAWFVGYVPQYATAAWVGYEQPAPLEGVLAGGVRYATVTGGSIPARMWSDYMVRALEGVEVESFPRPPPVPTASVPAVIGLSQADATATLEARGFQVAASTVTHHAPAGTVATQSPPGGDSVWRGSVVSIGISDGTGEPPPDEEIDEDPVEGELREVPDVIGLPQSEATTRLRDAGFRVHVVRKQVADPNQDGIVVEQDPPGGTELETGDRVVIAVGRHGSDDTSGEGGSGGDGSGDGGSGDGTGDGSSDEGGGGSDGGGGAGQGGDRGGGQDGDDGQAFGGYYHGIA